MDQLNLAVRFADTVARHGELVATRIDSPGGWITRTYAELGADVDRLAAQLLAWNVQPGDRVLLFALNRPEWSLIDFACLTVRAVSVPIYTSSTPDQVQFMAADAGVILAFCEGQREVDLVTALPDVPELTRIIAIDPVTSDDPRVTQLSDALASGAPKAPVGERLAQASGDDLASIIYTSGTTGVPKGVMLANRGFVSQIDVLADYFDVTTDDHSLCFLPLSHAFERAWTFFVLTKGCMNTYWPDAKTVAAGMVRAQTTMMTSVPRLFEKVFTTVHQRVADSPPKKKVLEWALRVGARNQHAFRKGGAPSPFWRAQLALADKLVLHSVRDAMGGPKKVMACGGAPLRKEIEEFFSACGMLLEQGYGMTEASPLISFNAPEGFKFGTAGRVLPGGEIKIADEGEICYRGPNVMLGYWNNPEATAATIRDGWLHTGDVGYVDTDGYVVITDRIKDLIVTSNGKNIAPAPIEGMILADPLFEQAVVLGDNRPFVTLLVSPSLPNLESLGRQLSLTWENREDLFKNPAILAEISRRVQAMTVKLPHHEQIKDLRVMIEEFTQENGLLTPTLKVKRREVEKRFAQVIDDMYAKLAEVRKGGSE